MSSLGLGVDIEEVGRFKKLIRNPRFLNRVYTKQEIAYCRTKKNQGQHFAVRFAAKEAVWKAIGDSLRRMNKPISHKDIGVRNLDSGKPAVTLPSSLKKIELKIQISLSHTRTHAVAVAVLQS